MKKRLAIITTHPIQYNAPLFELLTSRNNIEIKIFYTWGDSVLKEKYDPGFGKSIQWDIDLLKGYSYLFLENVAKEKGSHHYNGIDNPDVINQIKIYNPESILIYGWPLKSHYKVMRYFKGKLPVYFRGDSILKISDDWIRKFLKRIYISWVYRSIDKAFYTGSMNKDYFINYGISESNLIYAPHAVNNDFFRNAINDEPERSINWRRSLGIEDQQIVFMYAGKLDKNKNTDYLLDNFVLMDSPSAHMVIAGDGDEKNSLVNKFGKHERIHFLPFQNQSAMPFLYNLSDVFVLPSKNETWGLSINEAMACGKAILTNSTIGAAKDLVINKINGLVFDESIQFDLLSKMKLLVDKETVLEMGKQSLIKIKDWNYVKIAEVIEDTLNKNR